MSTESGWIHHALCAQHWALCTWDQTCHCLRGQKRGVEGDVSGVISLNPLLKAS